MAERGRPPEYKPEYADIAGIILRERINTQCQINAEHDKLHER